MPSTIPKLCAPGRSIADLWPELAKEYASDLNAPLVSQVGFGSGTPVWWRCVAGHVFAQAPSKRTGNRTPEEGYLECQDCARADRLLLVVCPQAAAEYDTNRNPRNSLAKVTVGSEKKVWWLCENQHSFEASPALRLHYWKTKGIVAQCPTCKFSKSSVALHLPQLAPLYSPENRVPFGAASMSQKDTLWSCAKGHSYRRPAREMVNKKGALVGCPTCVTYERSIAMVFPQLLAEYDLDKNVSSPTVVRASTHDKVWWLCSAGHSFEKTSRSRIDEHGRVRQCPECALAVGNLALIFPEIAAELDSEKSGFEAHEVMSATDQSAWWRCSEGHSYERKISTRTAAVKNGRTWNCPECRMDIMSIAARNPLAALEVDPDLNEKKANEVRYSSGRMIWWRCARNHLWQATAASRMNGDGFIPCQTCNLEDNCITAKSPGLALEFDSKRNKTEPHLVFGTSLAIYWWKCKKGHRWEASSFSRINVLTPGGYVPCQKCRLETQNLRVRFPLISEEFDEKRNKKLATEVFGSSNDVHWWKCAVDQSHTWQSAISSRTSQGTSCPRCTMSGTSRKEVYISFELLSAIPYDRDMRKVGGTQKRSWNCDMVLEEQRLVVEYDGEYYHAFEGSHEADMRKTRDLEANGWRVVRIRSAKLAKVNDLDLVVDQKKSPSEIVELLVDHLTANGLLPDSVDYVPGAGLEAAEEFLRRPAAVVPTE